MTQGKPEGGHPSKPETDHHNEPKLNPGFLGLDNVVLAPHVGSSTEATRRAMAMTAAKNAVAALTGGTPPNLINPEARRKPS